MSIQCPVCHSQKITDYQFYGEKKTFAFNGKSFSYAQCLHCSLIFSNPLPTEEDVETYYSKHFAYDQYERIKDFKRWQAQGRARDLEGYFGLLNIRRILDVGAGHGYFVESLAQTGREAFGFDISASPSLRTLANGKLYYLPSLSELPEADFELITMWHTLEHIPQPYPFLAEAIRRLKPGGCLLVAVPNAQSLGLRTSGYRWNWLQDPYVHPLHFNAANLALAMEHSGLNVISTHTRDTWDSNLGDSLPIFRKPKNVLVNALPKSWAFYINQAYRLCFTGVSRLVSPFRSKTNGAELIVIARKPE